MQKALDQMNLQIHRVLNDITGVSGLKILDAILAGERDPLSLARLCHGGVKNSEDTIAKSLEGDYPSAPAACEGRYHSQRVHAGVAREREEDGRIGLHNADERRGIEAGFWRFATKSYPIFQNHLL